MGQIKDLTKQAHDNAVLHGFYEKEPSFGDLISLIHSELSEALEEHRNGYHPTETYYNNTCEYDCMPFADCENCCKVTAKKEGIPSELADVVIRVFDMCGHYGIDLEAAIIDKMEYNKTRPYKHGREG